MGLKKILKFTSPVLALSSRLLAHYFRVFSNLFQTQLDFQVMLVASVSQVIFKAIYIFLASFFMKMTREKKNIMLLYEGDV